MTALNVTGELDTTGDYGIDGPGPCDCDYAPAGHTEDQCAPEGGEHRHQFTDWFPGPSGSYRFCEDPTCNDGEIR